MLKGLQARLTLSYVVIIVVCLVLVGGVAWLLLRGYQRSLAWSRLHDRSDVAALRVTDLLRRGVLPQEAVRRVTQQLNQDGQLWILVYLLDAGGVVLAGGDERLDGQRFEQLSLRQSPAPSWPVRGERRLAAGERLLYVARPLAFAGEVEPVTAGYTLLLAQPYRTVRTALGDLLPRLAWAGAVALALSIIVAAVMAYSIARPLERIARAAEEIAAGHYDQQLDISAPSEVARLAASFNRMARRVEATLQSQRDFVANVSHDLKTPLTSIQGFSQALLDGTARDEAARERAATVIHEEAGRMQRLVNDLLDLARLEAGQVTLAHEPVDLGGVLQACAARVAPPSAGMGVAVEVDVAGPLPLVAGDKDRLGQVFANLLDNALKHAQGGGEAARIVLRAEQRAGWAVCSVTDNGPGIPADDLPRIFERFYQVDKSRVRRSEGSGLGLAIALEIVRAHGGLIRAESVEGLGTRFTVELPVLAG